MTIKKARKLRNTLMIAGFLMMLLAYMETILYDRSRRVVFLPYSSFSI